MIYHMLILLQGCVWGRRGQNLPQQLRALGGTHPGQDAHIPQGHSYIHGGSDWDNVDMPLTSGPIFGIWEKPESPEKTHTGMRRTHQLHTAGHLGWESIFSPSSTL